MQQEVDDASKAKERYRRVTSSTVFNSNWLTNIESSTKSREKQIRARRILLNLLSDSERPVLNAGSNVGFHSFLASRRGFEVVSLDPSIASLKGGLMIGWITDAICADVMHLPFRCDSFSCTILAEVIEEIPEQQSALIEIAEVSSRIIITTSPIRSDVFYNLAKRVKGIIRKKPIEDAHISEVHPSYLFDILLKSGFSTKLTSFHNPFHIWNIAAMFPGGETLDLSPLDELFGSSKICASLLFVADRSS